MEEKVKVYKIATNVSIVEKTKLEDNAFGWMICEGNKFTIEIRKGLSDLEKSLIFFHELCHFIQTISEEDKKNVDEEKIAELVEQIVYLAVKKYPPLMKGFTSILFDSKEKDKVNLSKSKKSRKSKRITSIYKRG